MNRAHVESLGKLLVLAAVFAAADARAMQRTFLASYGSDANDCSLAAPCLTFPRALEVTDDGGQSIVLDYMVFDPFDMTKRVTISANPGVRPVILGANWAVAANQGGTIKGFDIVGTSSGDTWGIAAHAYLGRTYVEDCVISGFGRGIDVNGGDLVVSNSTLRNNDVGVYASYSGSALVDNTQLVSNGRGITAEFSLSWRTTHVTVRHSHASFNLVGFWVGDDATLVVDGSTATHNDDGISLSGVNSIVTVGRSTVTGNQRGFYNNVSVFRTLGDNLVDGNTVDVDGTVTPVSGY